MIHKFLEELSKFYCSRQNNNDITVFGDGSQNIDACYVEKLLNGFDFFKCFIL